jgi:hypothetical protein
MSLYIASLVAFDETISRQLLSWAAMPSGVFLISTFSEQASSVGYACQVKLYS